MKAKNLNHVILFPLCALILLSCEKSSTSSTMDVYSDFSINGMQFGCSETIDLEDITNSLGWGVNNNGGSESDVYLSFISPQDGNRYIGFNLISRNGTTLKLGANSNCELYLLNGNTTYSSDEITINITHKASSVKDYYEGTFSGVVTEVDMSNWTSNDYQANGSFKVPLWYE